MSEILSMDLHDFFIPGAAGDVFVITEFAVGAGVFDTMAATLDVDDVVAVVAQIIPLPVCPDLQTQLNDTVLFVQSALLWQL